MFQFLTQKGRTAKRAARALYLSLVAQSRNPVFYHSFAVPDTVDGRFEMVALHTGLLVDRLCYKNASRDNVLLAQSLFDAMFINLDWAVREMGVGGRGVPRQMKRTMAAFTGRAVAYGEAVRSGRGPAVHALMRNVYGGVTSIDGAKVEALAAYIDALTCSYWEQLPEDLMRGEISFPAVETFIGACPHVQKIAS